MIKNKYKLIEILMTIIIIVVMLLYLFSLIYNQTGGIK